MARRSVGPKDPQSLFTVALDRLGPKYVARIALSSDTRKLERWVSNPARYLEGPRNAHNRALVERLRGPLDAFAQFERRYNPDRWSREGPRGGDLRVTDRGRELQTIFDLGTRPVRTKAEKRRLVNAMLDAGINPHAEFTYKLRISSA